MKTISDALRQLLTERAGAPKWRRAAILDRLLWDVFRSEWKRLQPDFSTIFLNSTAHFQHYYWRDMEPEKFNVPPNPSAKASDAILFGYRRMDAIVGECLELAGSSNFVVLCSALGQQPLTKYDDNGGKLIFKLRDAGVLLKFAGFRGSFDYSPVMAEQFHLIFKSEEEAKDAYERLRALHVGNEPLMDVRVEGTTIFGGCGLIRNPGETACVTSRRSNASLPFNALFYPVDALKSGMHHPDGLFWISGPGIRHVEHANKLPITKIADVLLSCLYDQPETFQNEMSIPA